ncbi:MAG: hypothetical protein ACFCVD_25600, partial [Nodosilinea sp.]
QQDPVNFEKLVVSTEETIRSEHGSWLQDMQDRLADLYGDESGKGKYIADSDTEEYSSVEDISEVEKSGADHP